MESQYARPKLMIWVCFECGRSVSCPESAVYMPNTICHCRYPDYLTIMSLVTPSVQPAG